MSEEAQNGLSNEISSDIENKSYSNFVDYDKDVIYLDRLIITMSKDRKHIAFLECD